MKTHFVIVSRHPATREVLKNLAPRLLGRKPDVVIELDHLTDKEIEDLKHAEGKVLFAGNVPIELLLRLLNTFRNPVFIVSLNVPRELRGQELGAEELQKFMKIFRVSKVEAEMVFP